MFGHIRDSLEVLERDEHMKNVLFPCKFIKSKRQEIDFKRLLITAFFFSEQTHTPKVSKCKQSSLCKEMNMYLNAAENFS